MNLLLTLLGNVNDNGASVTKGTLEVIVLILLIVVLLFMLLRPGGWIRR